MATVTKPMALDETLQATNAQLETTDATPVNIADVLQAGLADVVSAINSSTIPDASDVSFDDTSAGLGVSNVQEAIDELATEKADSATTLSGYGITDAYTQTETDSLLSAKQNTLTFDDTPTEDSTNPVKSGGVYDELADKVSYADNGVLGAKNLLPMSLAAIKSANTSGTWSDNVYSYNGVYFTINTDSDGNVIGINIDGTSSAGTTFYLFSGVSISFSGSYIFSGIASFLNGTAAFTCTFANGTVDVFGSDVTSSVSDTLTSAHIYIWSGKSFSDLVAQPMIRLATDTDSTFQPYAMTNKELTSKMANLSATDVSFDDTSAGLGVSNVQDAIDALNDNLATTTANLSGMTVAYLGILNNETSSYTVANNSRIVLFSFASSASRIYLTMITCGTSGTTYEMPFTDGGTYGSDITVATSTNSISITTTGYIYVFALVFRGSIS